MRATAGCSGPQYPCGGGGGGDRQQGQMEAREGWGLGQDPSPGTLTSLSHAPASRSANPTGRSFRTHQNPTIAAMSVARPPTPA